MLETNVPYEPTRPLDPSEVLPGPIALEIPRGTRVVIRLFGVVSLLWTTSLSVLWCIRSTLEGIALFSLYGCLAGLPLGALGILYAVRSLRSEPGARIMADHEGFWPSRLARDAGLVRYRDIHDLRERRFLGHAELHDEQGRELARIDHRLEDYVGFRAFLLERMPRPVSSLVEQGDVKLSFREAAYRGFGVIFTVAAFVTFASLARPQPPAFWFSAFVAAAMGLGMLAITPYRLRWEGDRITAHFPFRERTFRRDEIEFVTLIDDPALSVWVHPRGSRIRYRFADMGVPAVDLARRLIAWHAAGRPRER